MTPPLTSRATPVDPTPPPDAQWRAQELLLMREVMRLIGKSLAPGVVLREMLHLMSELLGLNRGRIVLLDTDAPAGQAGARIAYAYGLTRAEAARGVYAPGEGITGRVLASGQPVLVQDIDAEPLFLARAVTRAQLPPETVAFMALPIEVNHQTVGVLACHRIRSRLRHLNDDMALLLGESGTGKELFARALHLSSQRRDAPFIKVNCAAIPDTLFESELFGYERGAFTGAAGARAGWFEQADHGTIFLDEIGDLPLAMQTKLLRTLQEGTIVRLGGKREIKIDVRLVTATHRDLEAEVARGSFRQDLYYRISVVPIHLPSLRERREDIRTLALHFVNRANQANQRNVNLSSAALSRLQAHPWPGNIRELGNVIERLVLLTDSTMVSAAELERFLPKESTGTMETPPAWLAASHPHAPGASAPLVRNYLPADSHTLEELQQVLALHRGNQSRAAQARGLTVRQFGYRLRKGQAAG